MKRKLIWLVTLALLLSAVISLPMTVHATICDTHTYGEWQTRTEATCDYPGFQVRYCKDCGWEDSRNYPPALGHNFQFVVRDQPSCTTPGYGIDTCTRCGANRDNGRRIDALGHSYQRKVAQEATCTKDGTAVYTCSRCGDSYREPIPATGHSWQNEHKDATCTAAGYDRQKCSKCGVIQNEKSIPATGHKWGVWVDGDPATCVQYGNRYHECTRCGQKEWERNYAGGLGDHDWGEWVTVKEPTATEPGLQERTCKVEASHKEQQEIPATGVDEKPALSITLWSEDVDSYSPKTEFAVGESIRFTGSVTNIGNVDIELYDSDEKLSSGWSYSGSTPETRYLLKPGETVDSWDGYWFIGVVHEVRLKDVTPGTETETLAGTITYTVTVPGYRPGTDEVICSDTASCTIGVLKPADEKPAAYDIFASYSEGPIVVEPSSSYERYWTAVNVLSENGGIDWRYHYGYADSSDVTVDRIVWREFREYGGDADFCFDPTIIKPQDHIVPGTETEEYAGVATLLVWAVAYLPDTETEVARSDTLQIPLLVKKEEPKPALTLKYLYACDANDNPYPDENQVFKPGDVIQPVIYAANSGNVPLIVYKYIQYGDYKGFWHWLPDVWEPNKNKSCIQANASGIEKSIQPNTNTDALLGTVTFVEYSVGYDPVTWTGDPATSVEVCRSETITRTWKVGKPGGPEPWPIPEESDMEMKIGTIWGPSDPAGYQFGEYWMAEHVATNTGLVDIDEFTTKLEIEAKGCFEVIYDNTETHWTSTIAPGETKGDAGPGGFIREEDVERGYIEAKGYVTWTDPDSGKERIAYSNVWHVPVISKTGLLLNKGYKDPANGEYFEEGEQIEWTLSMKNNSKEPIKDITITDNGATIGMFAEVTPEQGEIKLGVPKYTVTEYDAKVTGKVTNIANATGTDLKGVEHSYPSNPAVAKTGNVVPIPGDGGGTDPLGPIYGYDVAVSIIKAEAHGPAQEDWYALDENIDYTVTVKNTGKDPIENVTVYDSLNGFTPIGTVGSLAPNETKTFSFTWKVTPYNVDVMHYVVNQATVTYTFGGGISGTPMKSNKVYVKAGENGFIPEDGLIDPDGDPDGHFDPGLLHGEGDDCCAMTLLNTRDNEAYYQLTLCGEHAKVITDAKTAADAGDWKMAAEMIRAALDEIYTKYYEAGDDSAKAAVMNERLTYYAHIGAYQTLAGDKAAAEKMALKLIQLCSMANTAPETLPDSLANGMNGILGDNPDVTATGRVIGLFDGKNEVTDTYAGADARALKDVKDLLKAAKSYNYDEVFERGQVIWQVALDESMNAIYKAADRETRKQIAAWRISLDNLYTGERPMLEMLYPDNDAAVEEILMNLYRDTTLDKEQVR